MLIRVLTVQQPDLKVKDFELKCAAMTRNDVIEYIHENVYDPFPIDINWLFKYMYCIWKAVVFVSTLRMQTLQ